MRELKTIEVDRWEPSEKKGMVKHVGMISPQAAFDALDKHLKEADMLPDEYFSPNSWDWKGVKELPDYLRASCDVNWGGSEGIYLDIALLYRDENQHLKRFNFATGKTLGTSGDDFLRMSRIAAECSMMLNGRGEIIRFNDEPQKEGIEVELNNQMTVRVHQKDGNITAQFVDTDGEVLKAAEIDDQVMFEFFADKLYPEGAFDWNYIMSLPCQASDLVATYEEVFQVPFKERVTEWFGDYGMDVFKSSRSGVNPAQIQGMYYKALNAIGISSEEFLANKDKFVSRESIAELMKHKRFEPLHNQIVAAQVERKESKRLEINKNIDNEVR